MSCVFCEMIAGISPASIIYRDDRVMAFMTIQPFAPGECAVIPIAHVDHFTDVDDDTTQQIIVVAQRIGRRMRTAFKPHRVGMVVHGYGVAHAHLIIVPQHGPYDITSGRFAKIENGEIVFNLKHIPFAERAALDQHARILASE